jgi:hypothetical protein
MATPEFHRTAMVKRACPDFGENEVPMGIISSFDAARRAIDSH